jgi:hypothetical protein
MDANAPRNIVIEWSEVKQAFTAGVEDGQELETPQPINEKIVKWHSRPMAEDEWEGGSAAQTMKYVRGGYRAEHFAHSAEYAALSNKRHFSYNEDDGEIDLDRVFDGHDSIFLDREERESRPGLRLMIEFSFAWTTSPEVISQYGAWVASLIKSLESSGFDLVVDLWLNLDQLFMGDSYDQRTNVFLRVKQENEQSNFTEWSALFGPTGFRQLGFLTLCLAGQQIGSRVESCFGTTVGGKDWNVTYDREVQQVTINVNQRAGDEFFPIDKLNDAALDCGLVRQPLKVTGLNT